MLSPNEKRLYFISNRPLGRSDSKEDIDIWYVERKVSAWSDPINADKVINSFTNGSTMYFAFNKEAEADLNHNFDIYKSEQLDGVFQVPENLSGHINTRRYEADVFIAPDES